MAGLFVERHRRSDLLDDAVIHDGDAVADRVRLLLVVGDEDGRDAEPLLQVAQLAPHLHAQLGVEIRQGLVEEQHLGPDRHRAGDRDALLLAAGELRRPPVGESREADEVERFRHPPLDLGARQPPFLEPEGDVAPDAHMRPQGIGLEHHADVALPRRQARDVVAADQNAPAIGPVEAGDEAQQRRLPAAGRAEKGEELAGLDREIDVA